MLRNLNNVGLNDALGQTEKDYHSASQLKGLDADNSRVFGVFYPHERPHEKKRSDEDHTGELSEWKNNSANSHFFIWENEALVHREFLYGMAGTTPGFIHMEGSPTSGSINLSAISPNSSLNNFIFNEPKTETSPSCFQFNGNNWFMGETVKSNSTIDQPNGGVSDFLGFLEHLFISTMAFWVKAPQNENLYKNFQHILVSGLSSDIFIALKRENGENYIILGDSRGSAVDSGGNHVGAVYKKLLLPKSINLQKWNFFLFDFKGNGTVAVGGTYSYIGFFKMYINGHFYYHLSGNDSFDFVERSYRPPTFSGGTILFPVGGLNFCSLLVGRSHRNLKTKGKNLLDNNGISSAGVRLGPVILSVGGTTVGTGGYKAKKLYNYFNRPYSGKHLYQK